MRWKDMPGKLGAFEKELHARVVAYQRELIADQLSKLKSSPSTSRRSGARGAWRSRRMCAGYRRRVGDAAGARRGVWRALRWCARETWWMPTLGSTLRFTTSTTSRYVAVSPASSP